MKKFFLLFFVVTACSTAPLKNNTTKKLNIYDNLSFNEFKSKIINYAKNSNFPNLKI